MARWTHGTHYKEHEKGNPPRPAHRNTRRAAMSPNAWVVAWAVVGWMLLTITTTFAMSDTITDQEGE
ncbi:hypothetical protein E2C01_047104 [Portunus trituberculatus]|uniref:Uncharacterized protein n=1 Tax=Portunus trituberculatus TaxID=210409 RepID=A0A5B7G6U9_PORTR|nr:hypothetical protein [Portunus trituberculatus]